MNSIEGHVLAVELPEREGSAMAAKTDPLWTVLDVSRYLRLEPETVRAMARRGVLPAVKVGRVWRFRKAAITTITRSLE